MANVLAAVTDRGVGGSVDAVAAAVADLTHGNVRRLELGDVDHDEAIEQVLHETASPGVVLTVIARDAPLPPIWPEVVRRVTKPVVLVPPVQPGPPPSMSRALVPLDGTVEAAGAVAEVMELFAKAGLDLLVLHVFDAGTAPRFWDQAAHARRAWEQEFLARHCAVPGARLELRSGAPDEQVVDVASREHVDLITLGWSQHLAPGRAQTVRRTIADATVPVMLIPLTTR